MQQSIRWPTIFFHAACRVRMRLKLESVGLWIMNPLLHEFVWDEEDLNRWLSEGKDFRYDYSKIDDDSENSA